MLDFIRMFATESQNSSENICWNNFENSFINDFVPEEFSISLKQDMIGLHESIFVKENNIDNKFKFYFNGKYKTFYIYAILNALGTVKATSTESERPFSVAGSFNNKVRFRLSETH